MFEKKYNHPSYGVVQFNKVNGSPGCFMSNVNLGGYISLIVNKAQLNRNLSSYLVFPKEEVLRLRLSYHQFAELITNMNKGCGIPCTLEWLNKEGQVERYEAPPDERTQFETELKDTLTNTLSKLEELTKQVDKLKEKGKASKTELTELGNLIGSVSSKLTSNIPFVEQSFQEALDQRVANVKVETSAWIENKLINMGLEQLKDQVELIESSNDNQRP
jgi:hypothetical protein